MNEKKKLPPELEPLADVLMDGDELREGILALGCKFEGFAALMKEDEAVVKSRFGTSPSKLSLLQGDKRPVPKAVVELLLRQTPEPDQRGQEGKNQREWSKFLGKQWMKVPPEKRAQVGYVEPPPESPAPADDAPPGAPQASAQASASAAPPPAGHVVGFPMKALVRKLTLAIEKRVARKGLTPGRLARRISRLMAKRPAAIAVRRKLATVLATLNHTDAKVDLLGHKLERFEQRMVRAVWQAALLVCAVLVLTRAQAPSDSAVWKIMVNLGKAVAEQIANVGARATDGAGNTGARKTLPPELEPAARLDSERQAQVPGGAGEEDAPESSESAESVDGGTPRISHPLPSAPLPGQKRSPCTRADEHTLNGGCWWKRAEPPPCGEDAYEYEGSCYHPVPAHRPRPSTVWP